MNSKLQTHLPPNQFEHVAALPQASNRLLSLDLLRGLTIAFMILVNDAGNFNSAYWPLLHSKWNGCTPTDIVFPTFLFIIGITTVISTSSRLARGIPKQDLFLQIVRRTIILFLLGILVNSFPFFNLHTMRFFGILPRISVCYFVVATLYLFSQGWRDKLALFITILIGYWILLRFVPVPGYGIPTRGVPFMDPLHNLAFWVDRSLFSASHLSDGTHDITGLGSTLPSIATTLLGVLTAQWLRTSHSFTRKVRNIAFAGIAAVLLGGLWNFTFPINKELWTSSFVLFAGGISMLLLALFMWVVDRVPAAPSNRRAISPGHRIAGLRHQRNHRVCVFRTSCLGTQQHPHECGKQPAGNSLSIDSSRSAQCALRFAAILARLRWLFAGSSRTRFTGARYLSKSEIPAAIARREIPPLALASSFVVDRYIFLSVA